MPSVRGVLRQHFRLENRRRGDGELAFDDTGGVSGTWVKESDRTPDERTRTYIMVDIIADSLKRIAAASRIEAKWSHPYVTSVARPFTVPRARCPNHGCRWSGGRSAVA